MKKRITKKQLEVMKILWSSDKPLIASEILKKNDSLNINTVQACLRALVKFTAVQFLPGVIHHWYPGKISSEQPARIL